MRNERRSSPVMPRAALLALWASLASIGVSPPAADEVRLANGDTLNGTITERADAHIVFDHSGLGRLTIPSAEVVAINGEPYATASPAPPSPPPPPPKTWKSRLDIGANAAFGNTDTQGFNLVFTTKREDFDDRTTIDASYFYGASSGDRTTNKASAGIVQDWFVPDSKWFFFATARFDYDEFQSWEYRATAHGGAGYHLIKTDAFFLDLRGGAGASKEWKSDDEDLRPEALLGFDLGWKITERQEFTLNSYLYPDLGEPGDYRWTTSAAWKLLLDQEANMSLSVGLRNEYQSEVDPGVEHNDLYLFAGLGFDF